MAIQLEFINFIVPRKVIEEKYPGGWDKCLSDNRKLIGKSVWYDDHLFRDGAMNHMDMEALIETWRQKGFNILETNEGQPVRFLDACVAEALRGGAILPCDWIEIDDDVAFHRSYQRGVLVDRNSVRS